MAQNGRIPLTQLRRLEHITGGTHYLREDASQALDRLALIAKSQGHGTYITDSYRPYAVQVRLRRDWCNRGNCNYAATPGTSNHGWGLAFDGADSRADGMARWCHANEELANEHGWHWPHWARPPGVVERWHWEYSPVLDRHRYEAPQGAGGVEEMIQEGDRGPAVRALQLVCNDYRHWANRDRQRQGIKPFEVSSLKVDGRAGPLTIGVAKALLRQEDITIDSGEPIPAECLAVLARQSARMQQRIGSFAVDDRLGKVETAIDRANDARSLPSGG